MLNSLNTTPVGKYAPPIISQEPAVNENEKIFVGPLPVNVTDPAVPLSFPPSCVEVEGAEPNV